MLRAKRKHLAPVDPYVMGFHTERYAIADFDRDASAAGFALESRFATWDLRPWHADADFAVSVLRNSS